MRIVTPDAEHASLRQPPKPVLPLLEYGTQAPSESMWWQVVRCAAHWVALTCLATGTSVIWSGQVELGVLFAIPAVATALVLAVGGEARGDRWSRYIGLAHLGTCGLCFGMILVWQIGPQDARIPLALIGAAHTIVTATAAVWTGMLIVRFRRRRHRHP